MYHIFNNDEQNFAVSEYSFPLTIYKFSKKKNCIIFYKTRKKVKITKQIDDLKWQNKWKIVGGKDQLP